MKLKFGNLELKDWYEGGRGWIRTSNFNGAGALMIYKRSIDPPDLWIPLFISGLDYLQDIFEEKYPRLIGTDEEAKLVVDNFLIRMSGLIAFL